MPAYPDWLPMLDRRRALAEALLGAPIPPAPVDPSPNANGLFQQIFADYRKPPPDYIGGVAQRVKNLAGIFDPQEWRREWPNPMSVMSKGALGSYEDMFNLVTSFAPLGMLVHHGSPHKWAPEPGFPQGRPRLDKIGTGEGNTSYGWGWYSSEEPAVGGTYATKLGLPEVKVGGQMVDVAKSGPESVVAARLAHSLRDWETLKLSRYVPESADSMAKTLKSVERQIDDGMRLAARSQNFELYQELADQKAAFGRMKDAGLEVVPSGSLYTLDLPDEKLPDLLDWDKPLSEQSEQVRKAIAAFAKENGIVNPFPKGAAGEDFFKILGPDWVARRQTRSGGKSLGFVEPEFMPNILREAGIPGLRYLDAGSRGAGEGTHNYVIWDQGLLDDMARRPPFAPIPDELQWAPEWRKEQWRTARANATLPVEQGGLGLGPANTAAERAKAGGFEGPVYHGRPTDFDRFDPQKYGSSTRSADAGEGAFTTTNPGIANEFIWHSSGYEGGNVMPLMTRNDNPTTALMTLHGGSTGDAKRALKLAKRYGYDEVNFPTEMLGKEGITKVVFNPANIRSRFAAFDPKRFSESDLLASWLLPLVGTGLLGSYLAQPQAD